MATTGTAMYSVVTKIDGVEIEQVETVPLPAGKIGKIDLTNQDSGFGMEFTTGRFDPGDVTIKGIWSAGKTGITALKTASNDRKLHNFEVGIPDGTKVSFVAYVGTFRITDDKDRAAFEVDLTVNGIPAITTTYAALSTPFFAITNQSDVAITDITPAASATQGTYVVKAANTVTSVKITPTTAASVYSFVQYYNSSGVWTETAITTSPSVPTVTVPIGDTGTGKVVTAKIRVTESGKADAYYILVVGRPAS